MDAGHGWRATRRRLLPLIATVVLGCGPLGSGPALGPSGGSPVDAVVPITLDGRPLDALVAGPDGMRGRDFAGADAMLFSWPEEQAPDAVRFVMDGVAMPLDVAFFDGQGRWLGTTRMEPCAAAPCDGVTAPAAFRWALEAPAGGILTELSPDARLQVGGS